MKKITKLSNVKEKGMAVKPLVADLEFVSLRTSLISEVNHSLSFSSFGAIWYRLVFMKKFLYLHLGIILMIFFGCQKEKSTELIGPKASFDFKTEIVGSTFKVNFMNKSTNGNSYLWSFGDLDTSTAKDPIHVFSNPGIYKVVLITTGSTKKTDTFSADLRLGENLDMLPTADFDFEFIGNMAPCKIRFKNKSLNSTSYHWKFDDGYVLNDDSINLDHIYEVGGNFNVELVATKRVFKDGQLKLITSKTSKIINIGNKPSSFVIDTISFINNGFFPNSKIQTYANPAILTVVNPFSNRYNYLDRFNYISYTYQDNPKNLDFTITSLSTAPFKNTDTFYFEFRLYDYYYPANKIDYIADYQFCYQFWPKNGTGLPYSNIFTLNKSNFMLKGHWE